MKHVKQGHDECQLATIAMLSGKPKDEIKEYVEYCGGGEYLSLFNTPRWNLAIGKAFEKYLNKAMYDGIFILWPINSQTKSSSDLIPDLSGQGQITILWKAKHIAHAMAFNNGKVHDPNNPKPVSWFKWVNVTSKMVYPNLWGSGFTFSIVRYNKT